MFERFTRQAREIARSAEREARLLGAREIGSEHVLLAVAESWSPMLLAPPEPFPPTRLAPVTAERLRGLLRSEEPEAEALASIGISLVEVRRRVEETFGPDAWGEESPGRLPFGQGAKRVLELALREALELGTRRIGPMEILLGLLRENGAACRLLALAGVDPAALYERRRAGLRELARLATR